MLTSNRPDSAEIAAFRERGYLILRDFFAPAESAGIRAAAEAAETDPRAITVFEKDRPELPCRVEDFIGASSCLAGLRDSAVAQVVARCLGGPVVSFKNKLNFKRPGGGAFLPHQDQAAYRHFQPTRYVTAMLSVDPAHERNGCLWVSTNHATVLADHPEVDARLLRRGRALLPVDGGGVLRPDVEARLAWQPIATGPADLFVFDSFLPHYSPPNGDTQSRRAVFLTYNLASEGSWQEHYYRVKRRDPENPIFHVGTPTARRGVLPAAKEDERVRRAG